VKSCLNRKEYLNIQVNFDIMDVKMGHALKVEILYVLDGCQRVIQIYQNDISNLKCFLKEEFNMLWT
jgi:hypothetical protein